MRSDPIYYNSVKASIASFRFFTIESASSPDFGEECCSVLSKSIVFILSFFGKSNVKRYVIANHDCFMGTRVRYFETNVIFHGMNSALRKLEEWRVDPVFIKEHIREIRKYGLEYPMEHLIFCKK